MSNITKELEKAIYDYYITNRLIAYGEVPPLSKDEIEERCLKLYREDVERIRDKYAKATKHR